MIRRIFVTSILLVFYSGVIYSQSRIQNIHALLRSSWIKKEIDEKAFSGWSYYYHSIYLNKRQHSKNFRLATKAIKQRLDSTFYRDYNETDATWNNNAKQIFNYDSLGNILKYTHYFWDEYEDKWVAHSKREYGYDNDHVTQLLIFRWNKMNNKWKNFRKDEIDYNDNGNEIEDIRYNWDDLAEKWEKISKHDFVYQNDTLSGFIFHSWGESSNKWIPEYKFEYLYNDRGLLDQINNKLWDASTAEWGNGSKSDIIYDNEGNLSQAIGYMWDNAVKKYVPLNKTEYVVDNNNYPIKIIEFEWNDSQDKWVAKNQEEYNRDNVSNVLTYIYSNWMEEQQQFIPNTKFSNKYDKTYEKSDLILPPIDISIPGVYSDIINMPTAYSRYNRNNDTMQWEEESNGTFYYSKQSVVITALTDDLQAAKIYPNPAKDHISIELPNNSYPVILKLYDAQGKNIVNKPLISDTTLYIRDFHSGIYLYALYTKDSYYTGKLKVE